MGTLYLVPTPVGNMEDMTFRAVRLLKEADLILCEDTRTSGILLKHYDIHRQLMAHHKFNEHGTSAGIDVNASAVRREAACVLGNGVEHEKRQHLVCFDDAVGWRKVSPDSARRS